MRFSSRARSLVRFFGLPLAVFLAASAVGQQLGQNRLNGSRPAPGGPRLPTNVPVNPRPPLAPGQTVVTPQPDKDLDHAVVTKDGKFKLDFDKVDIADLVQNISDITGKLFIVPDSIHGKITIVGPKHGGEWVTADEAYAAFLAALDANSLSLYQIGKYYKIVEKRDARRKPVPTFLDETQVYPNDERYITKLFRLKHVDPDTVNNLLGELIGPEGLVKGFQPDLLIVSDQASNLHRLEKIIEQVDVPGGGDEVRVIQVNYASATELVEKLTNIFQDKNKKPGVARGLSVAARPPPTAPGAGGTPGNTPPAAAASDSPSDDSGVTLTRIIADERTNKLIVVASPRSFDKIEVLLKQLDVPVVGEGQIHVYYLDNAVAEQVSTVLTNLIQGAAQGKKPTTGGNANANPSANQSVFESQVKISPDKATNSLVIVATGTDYTNLIKVIKQLDVPRRQVFVEAVIMEVNLSDELDLGGAAHGVVTPNIPGIGTVPIPIGAEPFAIGKGLNSLGGVQSLAGLGGFLTGLQGPNNASLAQLLGVSFFPSFSVLLQALQTSSDTNVLSTPHILASDNEDSEITVGQNVPFQSGFSLGGLSSVLGSSSSALGSTGGIGGLSSLPIGQIQRTNVELKLKIKPQINAGDYIRMTIDESTEEIASIDPTLGPTTSKRAAKTVIVAKDQETVVIGGLMQDRVVKSNNKTPLLGDIPVLGWLFRYNTTKKQKVNLLLFLTPYIIRSQADFRNIFERKMEERKEFVDQFYGDSAEYRVPVDYTRKTGPLGHMTVDLKAEQSKVENGGTGLGAGEHTYAPMTGTLLPPTSSTSDESQGFQAPSPPPPMYQPPQGSLFQSPQQQAPPDAPAAPAPSGDQAPVPAPSSDSAPQGGTPPGQLPPVPQTPPPGGEAPSQ